MFAPVDVDVLVEAGEWLGEDTLEELARSAIVACFDEMGLEIAGPSERRPELSFVFTDDAHIRRLNAQWRGKDKPTNVLSFPAARIEPDAPLPSMLGDIVLAAETISGEARLEGKPFEHHVSHLIVHGLLHLLGHDHETGEQAIVMESLERRILARLAIPDPYA